MKLGEKQVLTVVKIVDFGVYLGNDEERVLLPKKQVPEGIEPGDPVEVFLYRDSSDRLIATTNEPKLTMGHLAVLEVADTDVYKRQIQHDTCFFGQVCEISAVQTNAVALWMDTGVLHFTEDTDRIWNSGF